MTRFSLVFLIVALVALESIALLNFVVDPYYTFRLGDGVTLKTDTQSHRRLVKSNLRRHTAADTIIIGGSRSDVGFAPTHPGWRDDQTVLNLSLPAANVFEYREALEAAYRRNPVKTVVFNLDFNVFNAGKKISLDYDQNRFLKNTLTIQDLFTSLFSWRTTRASILTLLHNQNGKWERHHLTNGLKINRPPEDFDQTKEFRKTLRAYITTLWYPNPSNQYCLQNPGTGRDTLAEFREIVRFAYAHDIDMRLVIPPMHVSVLYIMDEVGLRPTFIAWKEGMLSIINQGAAEFNKPPFKLWDFSITGFLTLSEVDSDLTRQYYWEAGHIRKELGDVMLDAVLGTSGTRQLAPVLNDHSTDGIYRRDRLRIKRWTKRNKDETALLDNLVHRTHAYRSDQPCE